MTGSARWISLRALTTPGQLPPLDGLRAVAILLVLFTHIVQQIPGVSYVAWYTEWATPLYNGWIGVDLFFVLSGFLVGGAVLRSIAAGQFSFRTFYLRRFFRILPAYFAVILGLCAVRYLWPANGGLPTFTLTDLVPNVFLLTDYWPRDIGVPSWSLSIEEHFYLLIPLLLFAARKYPVATQRNLLLAVVFLALLSRMLTYRTFSLGEATPGAAILQLIYFPFHNRMDALAMGVLVALLHQDQPEGVPGSLRGAAGALGILLTGFVFLTGALKGGWLETTLQYSLLALGFGAILWSVLPAQPTTLLARILSAPGWVPVARLSYSLYLTHLAVLQFTGAATRHMALAPVLMLLACVAVSLPLFLFIEEPLHQYARRTFR
jgi:peptidoglycan/LPS O-acetylase OafA/YrhL